MIPIDPATIKMAMTLAGSLKGKNEKAPTPQPEPSGFEEFERKVKKTMGTFRLDKGFYHNVKKQTLF